MICCRCKKDVERPSPTSKYCRECNAARAKEWRGRNRKKLATSNRERRTEWFGMTFEKPVTRSGAGNRRIRMEVVEAYGGRCACCGESRHEFLTIDHIGGGGNKHRATITNYFYRWLKKQGFPKDKFRLLCFNCNCSQAHRGYCPHERERQVPPALRICA